MPFLIFLCEFVQWFRNERESLDEGAVKVEKSENLPYLHGGFGYRPCVDAHDFCGVHTCHPLFKDYPQVIHGGRMEKTFLWFEVQVVELGDFEDVVYCTLVIVYVCAGGDADIVHVNSDSRPEWLVLENDVSIYVVHHGLEGCW